MNEESDPLKFDLTGRTLGDYLVIRRLGRGGMADVYLAEQKSLRRKVALKVLKSELAQDKSYVERFHHEAQAAAGLSQANIVQIFEVGHKDGVHFIAQEYVPGRNLRQFMERHGAVDPIMAINVLRQVAMALQKAGELSVIHRDIKPENIMLSTSGEIKVADFGLARINDKNGKQDLTQVGITMGTPLYMSPEQVEGRAVDPRSDIYSLGVSTYHMLTGAPPFDGENAIAIAIQHVNKRPDLLSIQRPDLPEELVDLIDSMMAKNPEDRPADASALLRAIRKIKIDENADWDDLAARLAAADDSVTQMANPVSSRLEVTRQLQSVMRGNLRSWWWSTPTVLLFAALLLVGAGAGFGFASRGREKDPFEGIEFAAISDQVERKATAKEQYEYAYWHNTEKHWKSVMLFHPVEDAPEDQVNLTVSYHRRANERIAELCLKQEKWEQADEVYESFINSSDLARFNVVGWAGRAIVRDRQAVEPGENEQEIVYAIQAIDQRDELLNPYMRTELNRLRIKYGQRQ